MEYSSWSTVGQAIMQASIDLKLLNKKKYIPWIHWSEIRNQITEKKLGNTQIQINKENNPIHNSIKTNKILRNKFNQEGEKSVHWKP